MATNFGIADLKTRQLPTFMAQAGITEQTEGGRHVLLSRFVDNLENRWNEENRDKLRKTDCEKTFTAEDILRFAGITEEGVDENASEPLKDQAAFAAFLADGGLPPDESDESDE